MRQGARSGSERHAGTAERESSVHIGAATLGSDMRTRQAGRPPAARGSEDRKVTIRRVVVVIAIAAGCTAAAWAAFAQSGAKPPAAGAKKPAAKSATTAPAIATVGDLRIPRAEFDQRFNQAMQQYRQRTGTEIPVEYRAPLRRQLLETMIRQRLVMLEARRRGMTASIEEAEAALKRDPVFQENGVYNEAKFISIRANQPQAYQAAIQELQATLPARQLLESIEREKPPAPKE